MKKVIALLLALALIATLIAGCSGGGDDSSGTQSSSTTEGSSSDSSGDSSSGSSELSGTIKIGLGCPLTGSMASYGDLMQLGAQLRADELNAEGGINGAEIVIEAMMPRIVDSCR